MEPPGRSRKRRAEIAPAARTAALALLVAALACGRDSNRGGAPSAAAAEAAAEPALDPRLTSGKLAELVFVPGDAEALVRVDLADVAARSARPDDSLKAFDFLLRAQQPAAWQVLQAAGIAVGRELTTLYLVLGAPVEAAPSFLVAALGPFDAAAAQRLGDALKKGGAAVEAGPGANLYSWKRPSGGAVGAHEPPPRTPAFGVAAVGIAPGLLVFGAPALVRRALEVRAGQGADVRHGALARDLLAVDSAATVWGAARPGARAYLPTVMPGLVGGHFSTALAAPGKDLDGMFLLRAEFASPAEARGFQKELQQLLAAADMLGGSTPLGATFTAMRKNAKVAVEGQTVVASASL
jgi:hypothetical protein